MNKKANKLLVLLLATFLTFSLIGCDLLSQAIDTTTVVNTTTEVVTTTEQSTTEKATTTEDATTAHTHSYTIQDPTEEYLAMAASCQAPARYYYHCSCGAVSTRTYQYGDKTDHDYSDYVSNGDATCSKDGTKTRTCSMCGTSETVTDTGSKLAHTFTKKTTDQAHLATEATCEAKATYYYSCSVCGAIGTTTYEAGELGEHDYEFVSATLTVAEHYTCSTCSKVYTKTGDTYTETTLEALALNQNGVNSLKSKTSGTSVTVKGIVIAYSYDGSEDHYTRHGFILKDLSTNDTILVNGLNVNFGEYKDKNDTTIQIGNVVELTGTYNINYNYSGTNQYYTCVNVLSSSDIEIKETSQITYQELTDITSFENLRNSVGTTETEPNYGIYKITGTSENPIGFASTTGDISSKNTFFFLGEYSSLANTMINSHQLVIAASSAVKSTGVEASALNTVYGFSSNDIDATTENSEGEITYFTGTIYVVLSQTTKSNYIFSIINYDNWNIKTYNAQLEAYKLRFETYKTEFNKLSLASRIYAFNGGVGECDIENYIDISSTDKKFFEIQSGKLVFVETQDENAIAAAESLSLTKASPLDLKQLALVSTAWAYYYQGGEIEYDQAIKRRELNVTPESATIDDRVYLDCSGFVNSVYYNVFGVNIYDSSLGYSKYIPTTANFNYYGNYYKENDIMDNYGILYHETVSEITNATTLASEIKSILEPGDIINYRYSSNSGGHVMLYVGNNQIIHCTGSSIEENDDPTTVWDKANQNEREIGSIQLLTLNDVFSSSGTRYILSTSVASSFTIFRPLSNTKHKNDTITTQALNRLSISGLEIEKSSSIESHNSVEAGSDITYTITLINNNSYQLNYITVNEFVPTGTTFVSASTGYTLKDNTYSWENLSIAAKGTKTLTFTVKVDSTLTAGTEIVSNLGNVNGVLLNECSTQVRSLKSSELSTIASTALGKVGSTYSSTLDFIKDVYSSSISEAILSDYTTTSQVMSEVMPYSTSCKGIDTTGDLYPMLANNMYGGMLYDSDTYTFESDRIRYVYSRFLEPGDIIITALYDNGWTYQMYLYVNSTTILTVDESTSKVIKRTSTDGTYIAASKECKTNEYLVYAPKASPELDSTSTQLFLEQLLLYYRYVVLRPSLVE